MTDRIFGYASAEPNIMIFGTASAAEYLAFASVCFGSVKQGGTPPNAYSAYAFGWLAYSVRGWRIRMDIQTG